MSATVTYTNAATGEHYKLGIELRDGETGLEAAWGRGHATCMRLTGWQRIDITVRVAADA